MMGFSYNRGALQGPLYDTNPNKALFFGEIPQIDHRFALFDSPQIGKFNDPCFIKGLLYYYGWSTHPPAYPPAEIRPYDQGL